ncbi:MAG: flavodoxin domain-containing protein, partial [Chromatiales bacterium]|nr:flavodoxin domain-containing protein [Chromatiales bacterium]
MQNTARNLADQPENTLNSFQLSHLRQAIAGLSREQLTWASGYLAGLSAQPTSAEPTGIEENLEAPVMTILYASQSGNGRGIAEKLADAASQQGIHHRLISADDYRPRDLGKEKLLTVVISTQGEGEPPENARELFKYLNGKKTPQLDNLKYAVFGLGDSSYEQFNQAGKDLDQRLQTLGATSLLERIDADVDFDTPAADWQEQILPLIKEQQPTDQAAQIIPIQRQASNAVHYDRNRPFQAEVLDNRRITTAHAVADVHHIALEIDPESLSYQPGDALGVLFKNDPTLVNEILNQLDLAGDAVVTLQSERLTLAEALQNRLEL